MKRVFVTVAGLLALVILTGSFAPGLVAQATTPATPDSVFSPLKRASFGGNTSAVEVGAAGNGAATLGWTEDNSSVVEMSSNVSINANFADQETLDSGVVGNISLTHDSIGRLHAVWYHAYGDGSAEIFHAVKTPGFGGGGWQASAIPGSRTYSPAPYKVVNMTIRPGTNSVYVVWGRNNVGARYAFTDDGVNWSEPDDVPGPFGASSVDFAIGVTTDGTVFVGWYTFADKDIMIQQKSPGSFWGAVTNISARANVSTYSYTPRLAGDMEGGMRAIWNEENPRTRNVSPCPDSRGCRDVWYREWTPAGGWGTMIALVTSNGETNGYGLAVDGNGVAHVTYDDDTGRAARNTTAYYVYGRGTSFTPPQQIPSGAIFNGSNTRFPSIDVNAAAAHFGLNNNGEGSFQAYYSYAPATGTFPTPTPVATNTPTATPVPPSPTPCTANSFSDVPPGSAFYRYVTDLSQRGAISGYSDCTFRVGSNITRGQIAKVIMLANGFSVVNPPLETFADVPWGSAFYTFIETAVRSGIISGYSCGGPGEPCDSQSRPYFRPYNDVTRAQLSKMVVLARGWALENPALPDFADVPTTNPFYQQVETAYRHGIISGYSDGTFKPFNTATRGQTTKIIDLALYLDYTPTPTYTPAPPTATPTNTAIPTETPVVTATATAMPTDTAVPATATSTAMPTDTAVPATATATAMPTDTAIPATATATAAPSATPTP